MTLPGTGLHQIFTVICAFKIMTKSEHEPPGKAEIPPYVTHESFINFSETSLSASVKIPLRIMSMFAKFPYVRCMEASLIFRSLPFSSDHFRYFRTIPASISYHIYIFVSTIPCLYIYVFCPTIPPDIKSHNTMTIVYMPF